MADSKETVVFEVNVDSYEKSLADLTTSINSLKTSQKQLAEQTKQGNTEAAKLLEATNAQLKIQQQQYRTTQNVLVGYLGAKQKEVNVTDFAKNSIQANRDLLKQLTAQYINTKNPSEQFTNQIKKLSDELKKQESAIGDNRRNVGNYADSFKDAFGAISQNIPALQGFATAQKAVNLAMEANPAGAVFLALQSLYQIFSQNKEIADQVSFAFSGLNKAFGFVIDTVVQTVSSFDNLTNALKHPIDFIFNLGKGAATAAKEGYNASKAFDELVVSNAKLNAEIEVGREKADALTKALKDRTKPEQERIKIANEIADLEISNATKLASLRQKELDALKLQNKDRVLSGEQLAEEIKKQGEVEVAVLQAKTAENQRQTRINILLDKEATQAAKENSKERIRDIEAIANENARLEQIRIEATEVGLAKEEKLYELAFEKRFSDLIKAGLTEKQIEELKQRELEEIRKKYAVKGLEFYKEKTAEEISITVEAYQKMNDEALKAQEAQEQSIISSISQISSAVINILSAVSTLINQVADENIERLNEQAKTGAITQKKFAAETRAIRQKAWKESKAIAITQAVMNTANAVMAQLSNPTPYVGIVLAALAAATGAIQIATIAKQKMPKFAKGGKAFDIGGKSHAEGGTPIHVNGEQVAEAEKGEGLFIMKKDAYKDLNMLSGWNQRYGGNSWNTPVKIAADGGMLNIPTSDGGYSTRELSSSVDNALMMRQAIKDGFKEAPAPELSIVELNNRSKSINRSVKISGL